MSATYATNGVDTYHLNVGVGDCTIVIEAVTPPGQVGYKPNSITLVDGGNTAPQNGNGAWTRIRDFMKITLPGPLKGTYTLLEEASDYKFTSIVITHWDQDHYGGVWDVIRADIQNSKDGGATNDTVQCTLMKYGDKTGRAHPLTTLYVPYMSQKTAASNVPYFKLKVSENRGFRVNEGDPTLCDVFIGRTTAQQKNDDFWITGVCKMVYSWPKLIGTNLFTGENEAVKIVSGVLQYNLTQYPTVADLITANQGTNIRAGFYIIGAMSKHFSRAPASTVTARDGVVRIIDVNNDTPNRSTGNNMVSIVAVIAWPAGSWPGVTTTTVSHYLAGDALWKEEAEIAAWINQKVWFIKLSHHGGAYSSPAAVFNTYQPRKIIVSAGRAHRHPGSADREKFYGRDAIYPTGFPYWMALTAEQDKTTNQVTLKPAGNKKKTMQKNFNDTAFNAVCSTISKYIWPWIQKTYNAQPATDQDRWLINEFLEDYWPDLSRLQSTMIGRSGNVTLGTKSVMTEDNEVWFVATLVRASPEEQQSFIGYMYRQVDKDDKGKPIYTSNFGVGKFRVPGVEVVPREWYARGCKKDNRCAPVSTSAATASSSSSSAMVIVDSDAEDDLDSDEEESVGSKEELDLEEAMMASGGTKLAGVRKDAPAASTPSALPTWPPAPTGTTAYICASSVTSPGGSVTILSDSPLDRFLANLRLPILVLEKTLDNSGNQVNLVTSGSFTDDLADWIMLALDATSVSVSATGTDVVSDFHIDLNVPLSNSTTTVGLKFSTACPPPLIKAALPSPLPFGYDELSTLLILGLDFANSQSGVAQSWNLQQVLDYFGVPAGQLQGLVGTIGLAIDMYIINPQDLSLGGKYPDARNVVWYDATTNDIHHRLEFRVGADVITTIDSWVKTVFANSITVTDARMIGRLYYSCSQTEATTSSTSQPADANSWSNMIVSPACEAAPFSDMTLSVHLTSPKLSNGITGKLIFNPEQSTTTFMLMPDAGTTIYDMVAWMVDVLGSVFSVNISDYLPKQDDGSNAHEPAVRSISIQSDGTQIVSFSIDVELEVDFGKDDSGTNLCFFLSYTWRRSGVTHTFNGSLWCPPVPPGTILDTIPECLPEYEVYKSLTPLTPNLNSYIYLSSLIPDNVISHWPQELDPRIAMASIDLNSDGIEFSGQLVGTPPTDANGPIPPTGFYLDTVDLYASYTRSTKEIQVNFSATVDVYAQDPTDTVSIRVSIDYDTSVTTGTVWQLTGLVQNLNMAHLFNFFPSLDAPALMNIMDHIEIQTFGVDYTYTSGVGSDFTAEAVLVIDPVMLDLTFTRTVASGWTFSAVLTAAPGVDTSFLAILKSLVKDSTVLDDIPSFLDIPINSTDTGASLTLIAQGVDVTSTDGKTETQFMSVVLILVIGHIEVSFIQIQEKASTGSTAPVTKRLLHASLNAIPFPSIPNIPLVGQLNPPFDEVDFDWVQDDSTGTGDKGLTRLELGAINNIPGFPGVKYQDNVKPKNPNDSNTKGPQDTDVLLLAGSHLILANSAQAGASGGSDVVLDYVFGKPAPPPASPPSSPSAVSKATKPEPKNEALSKAADDPTPDPSPETGNPTTMAKMQKTIGPLTISNVGLRYENSTISFILDALVKLGPIEFELLGFGLELSFSGGLSIRTLESIIPTPVISGVACSFNAPPVQVAGIFLNLSSGDLIKFVGGVTVTIPPYSLLAIGSYSESTFKSVFIFAELEGPLFELEVVEVSGICGGFGYNSYLRLPTIDQICSFPLVNTNSLPSGSAGGDPIALLSEFTSTSTPTQPYQGWISDQDGPMWFAAGLQCKAVQVLDVNALVVLSFNPGVTLGIFATAVGMMPSGPDASRDTSLLYIELGIECVLDISHGTFLCEASLSPNSFVLNPTCHLGGGFALAYWFSNSDHPGDWVFTVGGYHSAFQPPAWYPVPDRLSIWWDLGPLQVTGQAYFAITPKCCMGGGSLNAVLSAGPLGAHFNAYADFLINFSPFHFLATAGVDIGVDFTLDLWLFTIHISVDISAQLTLQGPPFGGTAYVDFWVFGFTVTFGDNSNDVPAKTLPQFYQMLLQNADPSATKNGGKGDHILSVVAGQYAAKASNMQAPPGTEWVVRRSGFQFSVMSRFAIETANINGGTAVEASPANKIYAKPMQLTAPTPDQPTAADQYISSDMTVTIAQVGTSTIGTFVFTPVISQMPTALWGLYDPTLDPSDGSDSSRALLNGGGQTQPMFMGLIIQAPAPALSPDQIQPFNALDAMSENVFTNLDNPNKTLPPAESADGWSPNIPTTTTPLPSTAWLPAAPADSSTDAAAQWEAVSTAWRNPSLGAAAIAKSALTAWKGAFGWAPNTVAAPGRCSQVTEMELDYLMAPLMTVTS